MNTIHIVRQGFAFWDDQEDEGNLKSELLGPHLLQLFDWMGPDPVPNWQLDWSHDPMHVIKALLR